MAINKSKKLSAGIQYLQQNTVWRNDTKQVISFRLYPPGNMNDKNYQYWDVEIHPGEELAIPSEHDGIIHQFATKDTKKQLIIGGLAPQLTNASRTGKKPKLHESLDVELQDRRHNLKKVVELGLQKKMAEEALKYQTFDMEEAAKEILTKE